MIALTLQPAQPGEPGCIRVHQIAGSHLLPDDARALAHHLLLLADHLTPPAPAKIVEALRGRRHDEDARIAEHHGA
jgi:hypothetical protein